MFNLSGSEIVFLLLLALIVLGPEKLPEAVRKFGKFYSEFKNMSTGFQSELKSALDEPMREMRETAEAFKKAANFDFDADDEPEPVAEIKVVEPTVVPRPAADTPAIELAPVDTESVDAPAVEASAEAPATEASPAEGSPAGNEPPIVRPPGPTFHSAAPQQPSVIEAVEETASE
jgi:sec-independent protein translocase protein TatB